MAQPDTEDADELTRLVRGRKTLKGQGRRPKPIPEEEFLEDQEKVSPTIKNLRELRRKLSTQKEDSEVL